MIIGVDVSAMGERNTGTSRYINCLLSSLNATGNEIRQVPQTSFQSNIFPGSKLLRSIPFIKRGGLGRHLYRALKLGEEMNDAHVDVGIFPNYLMPLNFTKPAIIVIHDLSFYSNPEFYSKAFVLFYKDQLKRVLKNNPLIATVSEHSKENISKYLGVSKENIFLLQPYVDPDIFTFRQLPEAAKTTKPYFLYVGHIEPRKNLAFLIRNFIKWKETNSISIQLKIAGELWLNSKEIQKLLSEYKNHPDIHFTGYVDEDQLHQLYLNASGFVHTSLIEGFGFPVLEAMHYGLPVLCSSGISTEEISKPGSITVNPLNDLELLNGFDKLFRKSKEVSQYDDIPYTSKLMQSQLELILARVTSEKKKVFFLNRITLPDVETAVERTLMYYKIFNGGINIDLIYSLLLGVKTTREQVKEAIMSLIEKNIISEKSNIITLNAEFTPFYIPKSRTLDKKSFGRLIKIINSIPFITFIAFSGGTALYGLENHDDIDLFIITKPYTVYIVYLLLHLISLLLKSRNILCVNYLVDEKATEINIHNDLYTAHQIITLKPVKNKTYINNFLNKNTWITDHYPNFEIQGNEFAPASKLYFFYRPLNLVLKTIYKYWYRKPVRDSQDNSVILSENVIKLHTRDYRKKVMDEFESQWSRYLQNKSISSFSHSAVK